MISNEKRKYIIKLQQKKYRDIEDKFLVEGPHLVELAKQYAEVESIYSIHPLDKIEEEISQEEMKKICTTDTLCSTLAICKKNHKKQNASNLNLVLALDGIQDPGNLGTLLRSTVSFGFEHILLGEGTVDIYNPKVVRSSQGAIFFTTFEECNLIEKIKEYKKNGFTILGTSLQNGIPLTLYLNHHLDEKIFLILGNEGNGVSKEILDLCDSNLFIEMSCMESLNVGVAGSILMYEFSKRKAR